MSWSNMYGLVPFLLSAASALACALAFKAWHKRQLRRSPLQGKRLGHLPGQQLLERIDHHDTELGTGIVVMYFALPSMFMLWAGTRLDWTRIHWSSSETLLLIAAAGMFFYGLYGYATHYAARARVKDGLLAERVTGLQLNRLVTQGCLVLHDLPCGNFNIDHVVIGPRAIYAIETKSFRKPKGAADDPRHPSHEVNYDGTVLKFPDFATREPIEQAARQAQWLRRTLRDALGRDFPVIPAVSLPGWYVVRTESGKRADTHVFTPMGKGADFMAWTPERIDPTERKVIAETLAARYPLIEN